MGRTKTVGIYRLQTGYDVDRQYRNERIRQCGFESFKQAESWLIEQMERIRLTRITGQREVRIFADAAAYYLDRYKDKASIVSDVYHLKAVMPYIGNLSLDKVHNGSLKEFVDVRRTEGRKSKTINLSLSVIR